MKYLSPLALKQKQKREANQPLGKKSGHRDIREMFAKKKVRNTVCNCNSLSTIVYKHVRFKEMKITNTFPQCLISYITQRTPNNLCALISYCHVSCY